MEVIIHSLLLEFERNIEFRPEMCISLLANEKTFRSVWCRAKAYGKVNMSLA